MPRPRDPTGPMSTHEASMSNDKVYIHELINIIGTGQRAVHAPHDGELVSDGARGAQPALLRGVGHRRLDRSLARGRQHVGARRLGRAGRELRSRAVARRPAGPVTGRVVGRRRLAAVGGRRSHRGARTVGAPDRRAAVERGRRPGVRPRDRHRPAGPCRPAARSGRRDRSARGRRARRRAARRVPHRDGRRPRGDPGLVVPGLAELDGVRAGVVDRRRHGCAGERSCTGSRRGGSAR